MHFPLKPQAEKTLGGAYDIKALVNPCCTDLEIDIGLLISYDWLIATFGRYMTKNVLHT